VRIKSIVSSPGGSVFCPDTTSVNRIFDSRLSYAKGAMILHQLRWLMGDAAFFTGLNNYLSDAAIGYGFARTAQLKSHIEATSGLDLTGYFNDWYTGEGFPSYQVNWEQTGDTVSFTVKQTQSHPSVSFFEMNIPVRFKNASKDTLMRFTNTFSGQAFKARISFHADSLLFDPDYQLISANNTINAVAEHPRSNGMEAYPNPASEQITFSFNASISSGGGTIWIFDHSGRLANMVAVSAGQHETIVNTGHYAPGLYFYVCKMGEFRKSDKIVIVR
jgi:hypothetical protein